MVVRAAFLLVSFFPIYAILWGWLPALQQLIFSSVLSAILIELLLINFRKIPFTCSYQPGKTYLTVLGVFYWFAFTTSAYSMAKLELWLFQEALLWIAVVALLLMALAGLILCRKRQSVDGSGLIYEDAPNPDVQTLGLGT